MAVLVIEQNIGVATAVSDHVAIMVNGRINRVMEARALAADRELQQRLLGVGRQDEDDDRAAAEPQTPPRACRSPEAAGYRVERGGRRQRQLARAASESPPANRYCRSAGRCRRPACGNP